MRRPIFALLLVAGVVPVVAGCTTNAATGESSFTAFLSEDEERRLGAKEHPKLVQQYGGEFDDQKLDAYISGIGQKLAQQVETKNVPFTVTVLDTSTVNAFALPGGYAHITRGILALADNEAEVAGVIGHEYGHIVARHIAQQQSRATAANIGLTALGVVAAVMGVPGQVGDLAGYGAQAYLQDYSRDQELEADRLGIRYMSRAGYDPQAMESFLRKLDAMTRLEAAEAGDPDAPDRFNLMASHPRTPDRIAQAHQVALTTPVANKSLYRDRYLTMIDGLIYGDAPEQGIARGRDFFHPVLKFAFRVPANFVVTNTPSRVVAQGPDGATILFDRAPDKDAGISDMRDYVVRVWGGKMQLTPVEGITVNGMPGATATTRVNTSQGAMDARLVAIREQPGRTYRFVFLSRPESTAGLSAGYRETTYSFRRLSDAQAQAVKPLRIRVVTVRQGDTVESLAQRMAVDPYKVETFRIINGLQPKETPAPGTRVKLIAD